MSVTIKDIAKIAGVDHSTVSRSLNDSPLVAQKTKERIQKIASDMGFEFNANARGLKSSRTETIALVYPENFDSFNISFFFSSIQKCVREASEKVGYDVIITFPRNKYTDESNIKKIINQNKVDGIIIVDSVIEESDLKYLLTTKVPCVFLHQRPNLKDALKFDFFGTDHFQGGFTAGEYFLSIGRKNLICITFDSDEFKERTEGFKAALKKNNVEFSDKQVFSGDLSFNTAEEFIERNKEMLKNVDGVFAQSDLMSLGVIKGLKKLNIKVPEDITVVGYDDIKLTSIFSPSFTTIHQPIEEITLHACSSLFSRIKEENKKQQVLELVKPNLVIR